jgi:hypothetical protein
MTVRCPPIIWPTELEEAGPPEDPTILLAGSADIAGRVHHVMAIRVKPHLRLQPDVRDDVPSQAYEEALLYSRLDELSCLADTRTLTSIQLDAGTYVIWVMPPGHE